jgi:hypothetical protein
MTADSSGAGPVKSASPPPGADKVRRSNRHRPRQSHSQETGRAGSQSHALERAAKIIVATQPTALIVLDGKPRLVAIQAPRCIRDSTPHTCSRWSNAIYVHPATGSRAGTIGQALAVRAASNLPPLFAALPQRPSEEHSESVARGGKRAGQPAHRGTSVKHRTEHSANWTTR